MPYSKPSPLGEFELTSARDPRGKYVQIPIHVKNINHEWSTVEAQAAPNTNIQNYLADFGIDITDATRFRDNLFVYEEAGATLTGASVRALREKFTSFAFRLEGEPLKAETEVSITIMRPLGGTDSMQKIFKKITTLSVHKHIMDSKFKLGTKTYLGKNAITHFYLAGLDKKNLRFIYIKESAPQNTTSNFVDSFGPNYKITLGLEYTLIVLGLAGFWVKDDVLKDSTVFPSGNSSRYTVKIYTSSGLSPLPKGIRKGLEVHLKMGKSITESWLESGGYEWLRRFQGIDNYALLQKLAAASLNSAGKNRGLRNRLTALSPLLSSSNRMNVYPQPVNNTGHINVTNRTVSPPISHIPNNNVAPPNAKKIGEGVYGSAYEMTTIPSTLEFLKSLRKKLTNSQFYRAPREDEGSIIIKYQKIVGFRQQDRQRDLNNVIREAYLLKKAYSSTAQSGRRVLRGRDFVPAFFFSGTLGDIHIICMKKAPGVSLKDVIIERGGSIPQPVFQGLEKGVEFLMRIGIVHSDLHTSNILVDQPVSPTPRVSFIDFGFAMEMSRGLQKRVVNYLDKNGSIEHAWNASGLKNIMNAHFHHLEWFHSNLKMLQYASSLVSNRVKSKKNQSKNRSNA